MLVVLGGLLIRKTSLHTRKGGTKFERRMMRRTLGEMLLIAAVLLLTIGLLRQFLSNH